MLFEKPVKMLGIFKACHMADFRHADVCCGKKSAGFLKTEALDNLGKGFSGVCFDKPGAVALGKMKGFCQLLESNGIKMFLHILDQFHTYQISLAGHKGILNPLLIILKDFCEKNHKLAVENVFIIILFFRVFQKHGKHMLPEAFVSVCVENEIGVSCIGKQGLVKKQGKYLVDAKSIMGIFSMDVGKPLVLVLYTEEEEELKKIYEVSVKTLAECMQDVFEDGPKRDRRLWIGDLRLQALANYVTFDNVELVKRCLYLFAAMNTTKGKIPANVFVKPSCLPDDTFLFDYSLFFISVLYDYEMAHKDMEFLKELFPVAKAQMELSLSMVDETGCLVCREEYPVFIDWSNEFNKDTAGQGVMIYVLKQFIALSKLMGEKTETYEDVLEKMISCAKKILFSPERGMFLSGEEQECNLASQVWMVLAHVMDEEENRAIMTRAVKELFPVKGIATPYMYHHVTEAFFEAGLKDEGIHLLKSYWGEMLRLGADTFWEAFEPENPNYSPYGNPIVSSYCHAWSCTPVYLIHKYLL